MGFSVILILGLGLTGTISTGTGFSDQAPPRDPAVPNIRTLLPTADVAAPWELNGAAAIYSTETLFDYINGAAELYFEYGFEQLITREFVSGTSSLVVDIYQMSDSAAAYGIYTLQRNHNAPAIEVGDDGTQSEYRLSFWQGCYAVTISGDDATAGTHAVQRRLAVEISRKIRVSAEPPAQLGELPARGLLEHSRGYFRGLLGLNNRLFLGSDDVLNISDPEVTGTFGHYELDGESCRLVMIAYPNDDQARAGAEAASRYLAQTYRRTGEMVFRNSRGQFLGIRIAGRRLFLMSHATDGALLEEILQ